MERHDEAEQTYFRRLARVLSVVVSIQDKRTNHESSGEEGYATHNKRRRTNTLVENSEELVPQLGMLGAESQHERRLHVAFHLLRRILICVHEIHQLKKLFLKFDGTHFLETAHLLDKGVLLFGRDRRLLRQDPLLNDTHNSNE